MNEYCYYCMNKKENDGICEFCGHQAEANTNAHHLPTGTVLIDKYLLGRVIGEGGFGITYIGRDLKLDMIVAVKEFYPTGFVNRNNESTLNVSVSGEVNENFFRNGKEKIIREARILAKFSGNKSIVDVRDFFECNNTAYIVMEYINGITLKSYIKTNGVFDSQDLLERMMPVFRALDTIHKNGLIHRDISPDNIMMLKDGSLKLMDFGAAREVNYEDKRSLSILLKPGYAPEEQYRSKGKQGPWTDVYAVCATIYKCITDVTPDESTERVYSDELKLPSSYGIDISETYENAIMKGMAIYQKDRYQSMDELIEALNGNSHEEMSTLDITDLSHDMSSDDKTEFYEESPSETDADNTDDDITEYYTESSEKETEGESNDQHDSEITNKRDQKNKSKKLALIILILAAIIIVLLVVLFSGGFKNTNNTSLKPEGTQAEQTEEVSSVSETLGETSAEHTEDVTFSGDTKGKTNTNLIEVVSLGGDTDLFSVNGISITLETAQGNGLDEKEFCEYLYHISFDIDFKFDSKGTYWSGILLMPDGTTYENVMSSEDGVWIKEKDASVGQYTYELEFTNDNQIVFAGSIIFKINSLDLYGEESFDDNNAIKITNYQEALDFDAWNNIGASVLFENGTIQYDEDFNDYMIKFGYSNTFMYDTVSPQGIDLSKYNGKTIKGKAFVVSKPSGGGESVAFNIIEIDE